MKRRSGLVFLGPSWTHSERRDYLVICRAALGGFVLYRKCVKISWRSPYPGGCRPHKGEKTKTASAGNPAVTDRWGDNGSPSSLPRFFPLFLHLIHHFFFLCLSLLLLIAPPSHSHLIYLFVFLTFFLSFFLSLHVSPPPLFSVSIISPFFFLLLLFSFLLSALIFSPPSLFYQLHLTHMSPPHF